MLGAIIPTVPRTRLDIRETDPGVFVITGEIDAHTAPLLESHLRSAASNAIVLDMSGVEFMDSSGLSVLVGEHQRRSDAAQQLTVTDPSVAVQRLLEIVGLGELLVDHTTDEGPSG